MFASRLARALMVLGAAVGLLTVLVLALEVQVNLPDWMVRIAMIKLAFIAAAGLLVGGALVGRHSRGRLSAEGTPPQIGEGAAEPLQPPRTASQQPIKRRADTPE